MNSSEEMLSFGKELAPFLKPNTILALSGDLGAGKTTFVQGLAQGLQIDQPILSPTFVYLNLYVGTLPLFHFDLYRFKKASDFFSLGFEEYFEKGGICAIEWPERIAGDLPPSTLAMNFTFHKQGRIVAFKEASPLPPNLVHLFDIYGIP